MADEQEWQGSAGAGAGQGDKSQAGQSGDKGAQGQAQGQQGATEGQGFSVPKEYAEKGWAKKVKTQDDVYKLIDNLDATVGKKMVVPDFEKGDPKEIEAFVNMLRPKSKDEYSFGEGVDKELAGKAAEIFHKHGIPASLLNKAIPEYIALEKAKAAAMYSKEGMEEILKTSFGDSYKETTGKTTNFLKENLSKEDAELLESLPNEQMGVVYRLAKKVIDAYGVKETGQAGEGGGGKHSGNVEEVRKSLRTQMSEMKKRPHNAEDYQKLLDQLSATYSN